MIRFTVSANIVNEHGDVLHTDVVIQPSDDPGEDWLDFKLPDDVILPTRGNLMFEDPPELMRALKLAAQERARMMREEVAA